MSNSNRLVAVMALALALAGPTHATIPVVDVAALLRLATQIQTLQQQLSTLQSHLAQSRAAYAAITGPRGMEQLLGGTVRNYLPPDWSTMVQVLQNSSGQYQALSANVQQILARNAVLSNSALAAYSPLVRSALTQARQSVATRQLIAEQALSATSARFASLQQLINAIPRAQDEKGALDLQARIQAEQGMLQNEQTKLQLLQESAEAEALVLRQQHDERALADMGSLRALPPMGL